MAEEPNATQIDYWNAARHWIDEQAEHDEMLEPLGRLAMDALDPQAGERLLDIGCGTGTTTFALAAAARDVVGVDISVPMLEFARSRPERPPNASFLEADAQTYPFETGSFHRAFSRFGVMFFSEPTAAFGNIAMALRPGGRIAFVCWQAFDRQEWQAVPATAAGVGADWATSGGPSPFALADRDVLSRHLDGAGFVRIDIEGVERTVLVGGSGDIESGMRFIAGSRLGRQIAEERGAGGMALVREALEAYVTPSGVEMSAAVWVVGAQRV